MQESILLMIFGGINMNKKILFVIGAVGFIFLASYMATHRNKHESALWLSDDEIGGGW